MSAKEIEEWLRDISTPTGLSYSGDRTLSNSMVDHIIDYITNLQEKVNQYENPDDLTLFYMWLDVKAKDKMKQLQEENERLKELCDKYEEEHNTTFQKWLKELKENNNV